MIVGIDRWGIVGEDGVTHQGLYDTSMFMLMPNFIITTPRNMQEVIGLFNYAFTINKPIVIRYPRKCEVKEELDFDYVSNLNWDILNKGNKLNIISYGPDVVRINNIVVNNNLNCNVIDAKSIKPIDNDCLNNIFKNELPILVIEQTISSGTLYDKVLEFKEENNYKSKIYKHSFDVDTLIPHGAINEVYEAYDFSDSKLLKLINETLNK